MSNLSPALAFFAKQTLSNEKTVYKRFNTVEDRDAWIGSTQVQGVFGKEAVSNEEYAEWQKSIAKKLEDTNPADSAKALHDACVAYSNGKDGLDRSDIKALDEAGFLSIKILPSCDGGAAIWINDHFIADYSCHIEALKDCAKLLK